MDTVAIETASEWSSLTTAMSRSQHWPRVTSAPLRPASRKRSNSQVAALWTSGRLCDFDGCEKNERFKPINVYGWFWSANNKQMSKTTCISGQRGCFHA